MNFSESFRGLSASSFETAWRSPSNIAFVKYWGKKGHQIPANPSLSMTLKDCFTETRVKFSSSDTLSVTLFLEGKREDKFALKIQKYLETLAQEIPFIGKTSFEVHTKNTFPHGTGIASSASGLSAFALCLTDYFYFLKNEARDQDFMKLASHFSRLASGSACRSVYGGYTTWGKWEEEASSDYFATPFEVHPVFRTLKDSVLVISGQEKKVSSTQGHGKMKEHFFAEARYQQAKFHFDEMVDHLRSGNMEGVGRVLENEALSLHAMMLTSPESYTLLRPNTLLAIEMIRNFREDSKLPLYFTLDAGPNLHLIYPEIHAHKIQTFITHELAPLSETVIHDEIGEGPVKC